MTRRRGFILYDLVTGLALVGMVTVALTVAATRTSQVSDRLAETRAGLGWVEASLAQLQRGQVPAAPSGSTLTVRPIEGEPVGERVWVEVAADRDGDSVTLTGLVPQRALAQWQQAVAGKTAEGER